MRGFVLVAALAAASVSPSMAVLAQAPRTQAPAAADQARLPEARTIIDRHIQAIGGRKAVLAHSSTRATGTLSVPGQGMSGTFEMLEARPNKALLRITIGGIGENLEGFDGEHAWSISPITGPSLAQGKELEQKRFDSDYYSELHDPARYRSITTIARTDFDGRPCYKISLLRKDGDEDFEFYDVATGLRAGGIATRESPMGSITATETNGGYKKFGDILQATVVKLSTMGISQVLTFTNFEYDSVPPAAFELPAAIKALIK